MGFWHTKGSPKLDLTSWSLIIIKKGTWKILNIAVPADHKIKFKENEKKKKYVDLARELKKSVEREKDNYTNRDRCFWYSHQNIIKGAGGVGNKRTSGDHPINYIIENGQNTEKSPGDLRRLDVCLSNTCENHQVMLMWKTLKN